MCSKQIKQNTFDKKRGNKRQKKYDLFLNTNICTMLDHVSSWLSFSLSIVSIFCTRFSLLYFSSFDTSQLTPFRPSALSGVFDMHYHKILKISPGTYIFQRPFLRGLFLEGLIYGGKKILSFKIGQAYTWREICNMYMRVFTVFEQFLCLLTEDFKCHTVPSVLLSFQTLIPA